MSTTTRGGASRQLTRTVPLPETPSRYRATFSDRDACAHRWASHTTPYGRASNLYFARVDESPVWLSLPPGYLEIDGKPADAGYDWSEVL